MLPLDLRRPPASALLLTNLGAEHGVPAEVMLRDTGLAFEALSQPQTSVTGAQEMRIVRNLIGAVADSATLGVEAGARYHVTTHGVWGLALSSCPTLRAAIEVGLRYVDLTFAFTRMSLASEGGHTRLYLDAAHLPADLRRFFVERETASTANLARQITSVPALWGRASFAHSAPPTLEPYLAFGPPPNFDAEANFIEFDPAILDLPLPQADPYAAANFQEQCRLLLEQYRAQSGYAGRVRELLTAEPGRLPDIETVSAALHMSSRTLRRHLEQEGTSYRRLLDEVRETLAEELLTAGVLSVGEVGRRLGYTDTPSFTAAFKRWKGGISPSAYARTATPPARPAPPASARSGPSPR
ncbi:AraC family transcriptional regulator [Nocardia sp. 2]|uniref:AraC family transcriptional regulator n=1 Tax=Nocardia acididurans TaxID=2802282 RepID=A0ABS1LZH0_9NOCA|nr:AraC family transcriptional regulator [Nocardia acididurans]MBL1073664.1 AraC family transcriptional regulator [Nocardia acididurans]